jgi:DNA-directed RNA polymerase specialized sigma24 family protein
VVDAYRALVPTATSDSWRTGSEVYKVRTVAERAGGEEGLHESGTFRVAVFRAETLACRVRRVLSEDESIHRHLALGEALTTLRRWAPTFLRTRLAAQWRHRAAQDSQDLLEDAIQHLMIALAAGKARALLTADDTALVAWCKRVLVNHILTELRRSSREATRYAPSVVRGPSFPPPEHAVETRLALERLVHGLCGEVRRNSRPRNAALRLDLLDDFLRGALAGCEGKGGAALDNRTLKRRSRGRVVARSAWHTLRERAGYAELHEVAAALGLSEDNPILSGGQVSFSPGKCQPRAALAS